MNGADARQRVIARVESEPIPRGLWDRLFDDLAEAAADLGVMLAGHIAVTGEGFEPAPGALPEQQRSGSLLARRLARILEIRTGELADVMAMLDQRDRAIREAINLLGPAPCRCEGMAAEVAEALRVLRGALGGTVS